MQAYHPGFQGLVNVHRTVLSDDPDTAVQQTISQMAAYASEDSRAASIRQLAGQLRGQTPDDTRFRLWNWIRARVHFVQDRKLAKPIADSDDVTEVLVRPVDIIRMRDAEGDCDDFSMLGAALAMALGLPVYFVTVAADPHAPDQFTHVYLEVGGYPFDASHGPYLGWEVQNRFGKRQLWSVTNGMPVLRSSQGLRGLGDSCPSGYNLDASGMVCLPSSAAGPDQVTLNFPYVQSAPANTPPSFWDQLLGKTATSGLSILQARYGVPPAGTVIQTPQGTISTVAQMQTPGQFGFSLSPPGVATGSIPAWVWAAAAGLAALVIFKGKH